MTTVDDIDRKASDNTLRDDERHMETAYGERHMCADCAFCLPIKTYDDLSAPGALACLYEADVTVRRDGFTGSVVLVPYEACEGDECGCCWEAR